VTPEALLALLFGLIIGSFLNVCIHRWPRELSVVRPRSRCPQCEKQIAWYDNIPVLSYLLLRGRCRHCGAAISPRYPLVELVTGMLFCAVILRYGPTLPGIKLCLFVALCIGLLFTDLEHLVLPEQFTLVGLAAALVFAWFVPVDDVTAHAVLWMAGMEAGPRTLSFAEAVLGAAVPAGFLWAGGWIFEKVRHKEGLGFGDVELMAMVGAFLGLRGALLTLLGGSLAGSLIGYTYIRVARKDPASFQLPFGTFLGAAAIAVALFGRRVVSWYTGLY
jgi:leader peptidase (prepilin peptidase)/N-methyltransferase